MKKLIFVFIIMGIFSCKKPGMIMIEDYSNKRIEVVEFRRIGVNGVWIIKDKNTDREFLIYSKGGVVEINK